jgi:putative zinc finger protein/fervidolysin-like protein
MNGRIIKFEGSVHAEADRLLPWWVNGTLPEDERIQVEQHVTECAQCQREAAWLRMLQDEYTGDEVATGNVTQTMPRLRRRMKAEHAKTVLPSPFPSRWMHRGRRLAWLAAAQAALILVLGVALYQHRQPVYHTLSAPSGGGSLLVVVFDPHISEAQLRQLVRASDARIVGGPTETGAYLLKVPGERASTAQKMLHDSPEVTMVENLEAGGNE